ncbi:hypothetical protein [Streptomyces sp. NPDC021622]|uniref:hypothetical protein n=1 Tax=Streptomyces sp. NPDC021622 TaxID=3155013 RepID=UPI003410B101
MAPDLDWDWLALHERLTNLATIAHVLDTTSMDDATRHLAMKRLADDCQEATDIARFLVARTKGGDDWWRTETTTR